jgi:hypothetical protein
VNINLREICALFAMHAIVSSESYDIEIADDVANEIAEESIRIADAIASKLQEDKYEEEEDDRETHTCCKPTARRRKCTVPADRRRGGKWYCHIHDPQGNNQRRKGGAS